MKEPSENFWGDRLGLSRSFRPWADSDAGQFVMCGEMGCTPRISPNRSQSELFGQCQRRVYRSGSRSDGRVRVGHLWHVVSGECDLETQARLLRVQQSPSGAGSGFRSLRRVGDHREIPVDIHVIAATNRDLHKAISAGTFREDLSDRLAVFSISRHMQPCATTPPATAAESPTTQRHRPGNRRRGWWQGHEKPHRQSKSALRNFMVSVRLVGGVDR
ncbi:MAG: sigma 54-interacting transcriptional regulator [Planctomycetaceae bacterium]|nr:sigma 54-interacting transcriptional regulator [Planctomycetaceae bacterium]